MRFRRVHLVGIGGAGMSAIARVLLHRGVEVSGSDRQASRRTEQVASEGGRFFLGHRAGQIGAPDCVVVSSAVSPDNPEVQEARRRGIPVWPRARMLGELMAGSRGVAVAGTHGKTTTSAMIGFILTEAGRDPTVIIGGELAAFGSNARSGRGELTVVEADESDRSLLLLSPHTAVVTNVEEDHLERFADIDDICRTFVSFLRRLPPDGLAVLSADDPKMEALAAAAPCRVVRYRLTDGQARGDRTYRAEDVELTPFGSAFSLRVDGVPAGRISLRVPGRHNIMNALGATAAAMEHGVPFAEVKDALARFQAPARRFEVLGEAGEILVVDDYAHHPTEVRAALAAARSVGRRVVAVFQPHRYTRTHKLGSAFAESFGDADVVVLTDIYAAGETPIPGVDGKNLAERIEAAEGRRVLYIPRVEEVAPRLIPRLRPGDLVLTMGAGNIRDAAVELLQRLQRMDWPAAPRQTAPAYGGKG